MEAFPSALECISATALLRLSSSSQPHRPLPSTTFSCFDRRSHTKEEQPTRLSDSCFYALTSRDNSSENVRSNPLRILHLAALYLEKKKQFKVRRRKRSKIYHFSDRRKVFTGCNGKVKDPPQMIEKDDASVTSSVSTSLSGTVNRQESVVKKAASSDRKVVRETIFPARLRYRAAAILKFLSAGWVSEVRIRKALGDSPDTSKALRMLVKLDEVQRSGAGGCRDPFIYAATERRAESDQPEQSCITSSLRV